MNIKSRFPVLLFIFAWLAAFLLGEVLVRAVGRFDGDGNFFVHSFQCYPYRKPLREVKKVIDRYRVSDAQRLVYDPFLGWVPSPGIRSADGSYSYNGDGMRTKTRALAVSRVPDPGVLRIAIFGDSYTHGDGVSFEDTWGSLLEKGLEGVGIHAEVLNFGVSGYGMDQSFLRWRKVAGSYHPHIVIFGLQLENIDRNVNLARPYYAPGSGIPFFKPRFILERNELKLINVPTPPLDEIAGIIGSFGAWKYSQYEYWYDEDAYRDSLWLNSKLVAFVYSFIEKRCLGAHIALRENREALSLAILSKFKEEASSRGEAFCVLYFPRRKDLRSRNSVFLEKVGQIAPVIDPRGRLWREADKAGVRALIPNHYSVKANQAVADACVAFIAKMKSGVR